MLKVFRSIGHRTADTLLPLRKRPIGLSSMIVCHHIRRAASLQSQQAKMAPLMGSRIRMD